MNNTNPIAITGLVATEPRTIITGAGTAITSFRLASTLRKFDKNKQEWVDDITNWYSVSAFRALANNIASSVNKGERVVVIGRLRLRQWDTGQKTGMSADIDADAIGHDLNVGTASFSRTVHSSAHRDEPVDAGSPEDDVVFPPSTQDADHALLGGDLVDAVTPF